MRMQLCRIAFMIGARAMLDGTLDREAACERNREHILAKLARREFGAGGEA